MKGAWIGSEWRLTAALVATTSIGMIGSVTMPLWLEAVTEELSLEPASAGRLASFELVVGFLGSLVLVRWGVRLPLRALTIAAGIVAALGYLASANTEQYALLAMVRVVVGFFGGLVFAAGNAAGARAPNPDRLFAIVFLLESIGGALYLRGLPYVIERGGYAGLFLVAAGICVFLCCPLGWLPSRLAREKRSSEPPARLTVPAASILAIAFIVALASQGVWAFDARIGVMIGLTGSEIGNVLAIGNLVGMLGAGLAAWMQTRFGRVIPIIAGMVTMGVAEWSLVLSKTHSMYFAMNLTWGFAFYFTLPFLLGTAAILDREGRWTAAMAGMSLLGAALGPVLAGLALERASVDGLGVLVAACAIAGCGLLIPAGPALKQRANAREEVAGSNPQ